MCGFTGSVQFGSPTSAEPDALSERSRRIGHRGPDDQGAFRDEHAVLDFRRLAIMDPSAAGHQPMRSADGRYQMVFNGEIYNYTELRDELAACGVHPRSRCDTEILLELFAVLGADVLPKLRGMFAFAVWDTREHLLFAARDPFGIKPFFYTWDGRRLRFASEKKALCDVGDHGDVDTDSLRRYLSFQYVPAPATMSPEIHVLPPGHQMNFDRENQPGIVRYWRPRLQPAASSSPESPRRIAEALEDSVAVHVRSDVAVGAFLSGGVDSAIICALAAQHRPNLETFTVGFEHHGYSEIDRALETAEALGVTANPYVITPDEFLAHLPRIIWHLDDPFADAAAIALWFLAREARKKVTVVLSGEGADELFGGYHVYRTDASAPQDYVGADQVFAVEELSQVTHLDGGSAREVIAPIHADADRERLDDVARKQLIDLSLWLPGDILTKADRMTMAHGLELRVPFLDRKVMSVASALALSDKIAAGTTKFALRNAARAWVPHPVAERDKLGFPVPIRFWLRDQLHDFAHDLLQDACIDRYIDRTMALNMLNAYREGAEFDWRRLWVLICFALWHQVHVEGRYDPVRLGWIKSPH